MGGSYRQCPECGKRALSIATRCPGCGREFTAPAVPKGAGRDLRRFVTPGAVVALLAIAAVLASAGLRRTVPATEEQSGLVTAETTATLTAAAVSETAGELRVARTWANVRQSRSVRAPLEAMLLPGDTVLADSLERGWYRVALYGEVLGYAHRSTLAALER